jgi:FkbM family methyltransferase
MKQTKYKGLKIFYRENTADESVLEHSFEKDIFFSSIPYYHPPKNAVVLDVGAHIGTFALLLADVAPEGKIFALEPAIDTFDVLAKNVEENNLQKRMIPCRVALYNENSTVKLFHDEQSGNWGHSIVSELSQSFEEVETITMDDFFKQYSINRCDLIKFNCEGAEFKIIEQASDKVINSIDTWIILFHEDLETEGNRSTIIRRLKKNGFIVNLIRVSDDNKRGWITATKSYVQYYRFSLFSKLKKYIPFWK